MEPSEPPLDPLLVLQATNAEVVRTWLYSPVLDFYSEHILLQGSLGGAGGGGGGGGGGLIALMNLCFAFFAAVSACFSCHIDNNECLSNPCDGNATCTNTDGSFTCACNLGYSGSGLDCASKHWQLVKC